jgi:hypothetical protein
MVLGLEIDDLERGFTCLNGRPKVSCLMPFIQPYNVYCYIEHISGPCVGV